LLDARRGLVVEVEREGELAKPLALAASDARVRADDGVGERVELLAELGSIAPTTISWIVRRFASSSWTSFSAPCSRAAARIFPYSSSPSSRPRAPPRW
jgi:hypothetical protein